MDGNHKRDEQWRQQNNEDLEDRKEGIPDGLMRRFER
jgi:hypothetical protein